MHASKNQNVNYYERNDNVRIVFAGTPEVALPTVRLLAEHYELCGILTNAPRAKGRKKQALPSDVSAECQRLKAEGLLAESVPIFECEKLDADIYGKIKALNADILVCFAYGKIFKEDFLSLFAYGGINIHPSLLPRWRGATPVPAVLRAGDTISGVTIQKIAKKADTGDIIAQTEMPVLPTDTTGRLLERSGIEGASLLQKVLQDFPSCLEKAVPQNNADATYCTVLQKSDGKIDWNMPAITIERTIRAFTPWPLCFCFWGETKINILEAHLYDGDAVDASDKAPAGFVCGVDPQHGILIQSVDGILAVTRLQKQSKKDLPWKDFLNGSAGIIGSQLS